MNKETYLQQRFTMFQYIIYEKQIEYNEFISNYPIKRRSYNSTNIKSDKIIFSTRLNQINKIINLLNINCRYTYVDEYKLLTYYYIYNGRITFDTKKLTLKQRKEYRLEIIFLYLYTNKPLSPCTFKRLFNYNKRDTYNSIIQLKQIIRGEIIKQNNIYILLDY
ncbi:MAG: hypothetical protein R3Y05_02525 [bacterium]